MHQTFPAWGARGLGYYCTSPLSYWLSNVPKHLQPSLLQKKDPSKEIQLLAAWNSSLKWSGWKEMGGYWQHLLQETWAENKRLWLLALKQKKKKWAFILAFMKCMGLVVTAFANKSGESLNTLSKILFKFSWRTSLKTQLAWLHILQKYKSKYIHACVFIYVFIYSHNIITKSPFRSLANNLWTV